MSKRFNFPHTRALCNAIIEFDAKERAALPPHLRAQLPPDRGVAVAGYLLSALDVVSAAICAQEIAEGNHDVIDGPDGQPRPNQWMVLSRELDEPIRRFHCAVTEPAILKSALPAPEAVDE